jgi:hypothetical protein
MRSGQLPWVTGDDEDDGEDDEEDDDHHHLLLHFLHWQNMSRFAFRCVLIKRSKIVSTYLYTGFFCSTPRKGNYKPLSSIYFQIIIRITKYLI